MSWDVVLFSLNEKISNMAEMNEDKLLPVSFTAAFENYFPKIVKDNGHHEISGKGYIIDYYDDSKPGGNIPLSLYGKEAIYALIDLAIKNNWQIFDTGNGQMIDLDDPSNNGYGDFQEYLNHVLNKSSSPKAKSSWLTRLFKRNT